MKVKTCLINELVHTIMLVSYHCWQRQNKLKLISITDLSVRLPSKYQICRKKSYFLPLLKSRLPFYPSSRHQPYPTSNVDWLWVAFSWKSHAYKFLFLEMMQGRWYFLIGWYSLIARNPPRRSEKFTLGAISAVVRANKYLFAFALYLNVPLWND